MNKIGIRAHDVGKFDPITLATHVKNLGFDGVQLVFKKAIDAEVDFNRLEEIKQAFEDLEIMMIGAYFNPVHPHPIEVTQGVIYFEKMLQFAQILGADSIGSETGSYMGSPWNYVPENHTETALNRVIDVFKGLVDVASRMQQTVVIEGAYAHVAYSPKRIKQMVDAIDSSYLKVTIDLFNFLNIDNHQDHLKILEESISLLKKDIIIFHLKDYVISNHELKQVGLGKGLMAYEKIIPMIQKHCPSAHLIFEGVTGKDIETSLSYIRQLMERT